jgi:hypothetical protein
MTTPDWPEKCSTRWATSLTHEYVDELERRYRIAVEALTKMAAFNDTAAQQRFDSRGLYSGFDEPGAVETSREALAQCPPLPEDNK